PPGTTLRTDRYRTLHLLPQHPVDGGVFAAHQILREEGLQLFDQRAQAHGVGLVQARVIVDGPLAAGADTLANLTALLVALPHHGPGIEGLPALGIGHADPEGPEAGFDA